MNRFLFFLVLLSVIGCVTQETDNLEVLVFSAGTGQRLAGVSVEVVDDNGAVVAQGATSSNGKASFDLPEGLYFINVNASGYFPKQESISVNEHTTSLVELMIEKECYPEWSCDEWTECIDGKRHRDCIDENKCDTNEDKPLEEESCVMPECESDSDCDDEDDCTQDECINESCLNSLVTECIDDDGCCPDGCDDSDCTEACVKNSDCDDGKPCTLDECSDNACDHSPVTFCVDNDDCCPPGCIYAQDNDCDEPHLCMRDEDCDDNLPCTIDECSGDPKKCSHEQVDECDDDDGCCPEECSALEDEDCRECASDSDCSDGNDCTEDECIDGECEYESVSSCIDNDNCCPSGCTTYNDVDCRACSTNADCVDDNNCTMDECYDWTCYNTPITMCIDYDDCCPSGCQVYEDYDCRECVTGMDCDDGDSCTYDSCSYYGECYHYDITSCSDDDGCCPSGCLYSQDNDCEAPSCVDNLDCDDGNACTTEICVDGECAVDTEILSCIDGDGCCPVGPIWFADSDETQLCSSSADSDCACNYDSDCVPSDACTDGDCVGGSCHYNAITSCIDMDRCCPSGCNQTTDIDCTPCTSNQDCEDENPCFTGTCDNGFCAFTFVTDCVSGDDCYNIEACMPSADEDSLCSSCDSCSSEDGEFTEECDDEKVYTTDYCYGFSCYNIDIMDCGGFTYDADGYCPPWCSSAYDDDCPCKSAEFDCHDYDSCTEDLCVNGECQNLEITQCLDDDGCCPNGCNNSVDNDCQPADECTENSDCDDGYPCTIDICSGSPKECSHMPITYCTDNDGCCPAGCEYATDNDCQEPGCETNEDCDDLDPCTNDTCYGDVCIYESITQCLDDDGCCPNGCEYSTDNDCEPDTVVTVSCVGAGNNTNGTILMSNVGGNDLDCEFSNCYVLIQDQSFFDDYVAVAETLDIDSTKAGAPLYNGTYGLVDSDHFDAVVFQC